MLWVAPTLSLVLGYLLGSIPFGVILTRLAGAGDLRTIGSGNIGATNVLRTGRKGLAAATLLLDLAKGAVAVLLVERLFPGNAPLAAAGAFLGHCYPVWLGFRGGKGVATYIGVLLAFAPVGVLVFAAVWLGVAKLFRYSSLAALTATLVVPLAYLALGYSLAAALTAVLTVFVYIKHAPNIARLRAGTEGKIGAKG
ncbi:MAG: glycerol-3-phosphate 1-O-acyltransferase [Sphingomonas sp.]|nr:MAG: glycerol-3-phosphate 1-O-acyltransferase [Sphingomonas sp.]